MKRTFTCIVCPNGCDIETTLDDQGVITVSGALCPKGEAYVKQELVAPMRTFSSSIRVIDGELPLSSVRLDKPVPKKDIFRVMEEIRKIELTAPVKAGTCVIQDVLGLGSNVIVTKTVNHR